MNTRQYVENEVKKLPKLGDTIGYVAMMIYLTYLDQAWFALSAAIASWIINVAAKKLTVWWIMRPSQK